MSHTFFVSVAYGTSALAIAALTIWIIVDHRARARELAKLAESGIRRRSDTPAEAGQ